MRTSLAIALVALSTIVGASLTLLLLAAGAQNPYGTVRKAQLPDAAKPAEAAPGTASGEPLWRERLRLTRAARCARATPAVACERVQPGAAAQGLTAALVHSVAEDRIVFVAFANAHYADFATSWVANLARANCTNLLLGAMDGPALAIFDQLDVASFLMAAPTFKRVSGQSEYLKLGTFKT
ncbi:hypothetical protein T492DRAFT_1141352 [Pavlovales sp. CCMP2436]|nr:hypothetical protein T492DRAFT_1141352 [Pavlovales sp. CCMP2436]|mmetsp:Transcript_19554/g.45985  ORF Transcript_19554/g.45985 Transcript_19554/m.45985 type:complete len:182 (-) Transcript_19554:99-644(-)